MCIKGGYDQLPPVIVIKDNEWEVADESWPSEHLGLALLLWPRGGCLLQEWDVAAQTCLCGPSSVLSSSLFILKVKMRTEHRLLG